MGKIVMLHYVRVNQCQMPNASECQIFDYFVAKCTAANHHNFGMADAVQIKLEIIYVKIPRRHQNQGSCLALLFHQLRLLSLA